MARSAGLNRPSRLEKLAAMVEAAHQDVGQDIEPRDQVELLEDHAAGAAPVPQGAPTQPRDLEHAERDLAAGRLLQAIDHAQKR